MIHINVRRIIKGQTSNDRSGWWYYEEMMMFEDDDKDFNDVHVVCFHFVKSFAQPLVIVFSFLNDFLLLWYFSTFPFPSSFSFSSSSSSSSSSWLFIHQFHYHFVVWCWKADGLKVYIITINSWWKYWNDAKMIMPCQLLNYNKAKEYINKFFQQK